MPVSRSDEGGSPGEGVMAVRGEASHKPSSPSPGRGAALDAGTKGFLGFGYKTKNQNHRVYRVSHIYFRNLSY